MRTKPTYDWKWLESHDPFLKILEKTCDLEIDKDVTRIPTIGGYSTTSNRYYIKYNYSAFEEKFEEIKALILKTNVCKNNKEIYDYINALEGNKKAVNFLVLHGCIKNANGSFKWEDVNNK